jgi:hypothetical protein
VWVADVGETQWEEINRVVVDDPPQNFGWYSSRACWLGRRSS